MLSKTPTTASSSTMGSSASTTYVHQKFIWQMCIYYFSKINQFKMVQRWSWCARTPSATSTWLGLTRLLRLSKGILITLYHTGTVLNQFVACRGRWGCQRAPWSPLDHFELIYLWKIEYKHVPYQFLMDISCSCWTPHGWAWRGWPRASCSPNITLRPF